MDIQQINGFASATRAVLKQAFSRKAPAIAKRFSELGRPMGERTVRKMTEDDDVTRRNPLEHVVLLLAAVRLESKTRFEIVWKFLEGYAATLRGRVVIRESEDAQMADFRYAAASLDRAYFSGDKKAISDALIYVDESLRGLFIRLLTI